MDHEPTSVLFLTPKTIFFEWHMIPKANDPPSTAQTSHTRDPFKLGHVDGFIFSIGIEISNLQLVIDDIDSNGAPFGPTHPNTLAEP